MKRHPFIPVRVIRLLLFTLSSITFAETNETKPLPSLEELARIPAIVQPALSSSGDWLATFSAYQDKRVLVVDDLRTAEDTPYIVNGDNWTLQWFRWLIDDRLLLSLSVPETIRRTPLTVTRLVLVDPAARNIRMMFRGQTGRDNFQVHNQIVSLTPDDPHSFLVQMRRNGNPRVVAAKLSNGKLSRRVAQSGLPGVQRFLADRNGNVRVGVGFTRDQKDPVLMLKDRSGEWNDFPKFAKQTGFSVEAVPAHDLDLLYVVSDHEYPLGGVYEFRVSRGTFGKLISHHPDSPIAGVTLNKSGNAIERVQFESELVPDVIFDKWLENFRVEINGILPNTKNDIVSMPPNRSRALVRAYASNIEPHYYLYEAKTKKLVYLATQYPELSKRALAMTELLSYEARDGLAIAAYVTLPVGRSLDSAHALPFVVFPHGGPHARDFLRFDWLVQLLAREGYGVLQMNFRGSTGYGASFVEAGHKQWGQAMQDDITDGTNWLIEQGWADPKRICIAGGSYGGYAALMGAVKEPGLYQCAMSLNGVSDLVDLLKLGNRFIGGRYYWRHIGNLYQDRPALERNSPARRASEIEIPVLLVHGEDDRVVPVRQSRKMQRELEKTKVRHTYLELPDGDHFLSRGSNRRAFARAAQKFLAENLREQN